MDSMLQLENRELKNIGNESMPNNYRFDAREMLCGALIVNIVWLAMSNFRYSRSTAAPVLCSGRRSVRQEGIVIRKDSVLQSGEREDVIRVKCFQRVFQQQL